MANQRGGASDAPTILDRMTGDDPRLRRLIEDETINARVALMIYEARTSTGLTQAELAARVGTRQPVIARLEDADYAGHSLTMLRKIAAALGRRLEIAMAPAPEGAGASPESPAPERAGPAAGRGSPKAPRGTSERPARTRGRKTVV